jgi:triosephosphate isomerase (TIM)
MSLRLINGIVITKFLCYFLLFMSKRKFLIAANWKMNKIPEGALEKGSPYQSRSDIDVWVFPTDLGLRDCIEAGFITGAQSALSIPYGARTGDISMQMVADEKCRAVLCGHSDRRAYHGESDGDVAEQTVRALEVGIHPIVCIGETAKEREAGRQEEVIAKQMKLLPLESDIIIAYEPVWAISQGDPNAPSATPVDAQKMHAFIRSQLPEDRRENTRILYGGSMKPDNAQELLSQPDIDGGLIGGASLDPEKFAEIIKCAVEEETRKLGD